MRRCKPRAEVKRDELYVLNPKVRVGDIVLTTGPLSAESELIKISTGDPFSQSHLPEVDHLVEANTSDLSDPGSVRRLSTMRIVATDPKFIRVLRLKGNVEDHKPKAAKAVGFDGPTGTSR